MYIVNEQYFGTGMGAASRAQLKKIAHLVKKGGGGGDGGVLDLNLHQAEKLDRLVSKVNQRQSDNWDRKKDMNFRSAVHPTNIAQTLTAARAKDPGSGEAAWNDYVSRLRGYIASLKSGADVTAAPPARPGVAGPKHLVSVANDLEFNILPQAQAYNREQRESSALNAAQLEALKNQSLTNSGTNNGGTNNGNGVTPGATWGGGGGSYQSGVAMGEDGQVPAAAGTSDNLEAAGVNTQSKTGMFIGLAIIGYLIYTSSKGKFKL